MVSGGRSFAAPGAMPTADFENHKSHATGASLAGRLIALESDTPQAHIAAEWCEGLKVAKAACHLQAVSNGNMPLRVQGYLNWDPSQTTVPQNVVDALAGDVVKLYELQGKAAEKQRDNQRNDARIQIAILEDKNTSSC